MKKIFLCLLLIGCSSTPNATLNAVTAVKGNLSSIETNLTQIENNLSPECKTSVIVEKINVQRDLIKQATVNAENVNTVCTAEKNALEEKLGRWRTRTWFLVIALGVLLFIRLR